MSTSHCDSTLPFSGDVIISCAGVSKVEGFSAGTQSLAPPIVIRRKTKDGKPGEIKRRWETAAVWQALGDTSGGWLDNVPDETKEDWVPERWLVEPSGDRTVQFTIDEGDPDTEAGETNGAISEVAMTDAATWKEAETGHGKYTDRTSADGKAPIWRASGKISRLGTG